MDNMNRFIKRKMYISQSHWGSKLDLDQANISRLLKKLINLEVLEVVDEDYKYQYEDKKSKVYGFTQKFVETIYKHGRSSKAKKVQDEILMTPYEDGITNTQIMSDIRILFLDKGYTSTDGIAEFIYAKDSQRPHNKQRGYSTIRKFVASYIYSLNERYRENRLEVS
jgi:hypothetical protein